MLLFYITASGAFRPRLGELQAALAPLQKYCSNTVQWSSSALSFPSLSLTHGTIHGSCGAGFGWLRRLHATVRSRSRQEPSKQGLSLQSSYKGCSTHVQTREGWKEREAIKSAKYFNNIRILRRQIS